MCESGRWSIKLQSPEVCKLAETLHFKGTLSAIKGPRPSGRESAQTIIFSETQKLSNRQTNLIKKLASDLRSLP